MEKAVITDQGIINDAENVDVTYVDNEPLAVDNEMERVKHLLADCNTIKELNELKANIPTEYLDLYNERWSELNK